MHFDPMHLNQIDKLDNTKAKPEHQIKGKFTIKHIPVRKYDPYNKLKDLEFSKFIAELESLENAYQGNQSLQNRMKILFTFLAEMNYKSILDPALLWVDRLQWPTFGDVDKELKKLNDILIRYKTELDKRHCGIAYEPDRIQSAQPTTKPIPKGLEVCPNPWTESIKDPTPRIRSFAEQRGSLGYLAVTSHSISRLTLYADVKTEIEKALETDLKSKRRATVKISLKKMAS